MRRLAWLAVALLAAASVGADEVTEPASPPPVEAVTEPAFLPHVDAAPAGPDARSRLEEIRRRVQRAAEYPEIARKRSVSGEAQVSFRIDAAGAPEDLRIHESSGSGVLDRAAERAVLAAAPLPRMIGRVTVPVRFELYSE